AWSALEEHRQFADLRERFPYESLEERLPPPQQRLRPDKVPDETIQWLTSLEERVSTETMKRSCRSRILRNLHEENVQLFANSQGFGVARMLFRPAEWNINLRLRKESPIPQPGLPEPPSGSSGEERSGSPRDNEQTLYRMHQEGIVDFANIAGFGFVKDRRHVAGFQPHQ